MIDRFAGFYLDEISSEHRRIIKKIVSVFKKQSWVRAICLQGSYASETEEIDIFEYLDITVIVSKSGLDYINKNIKKLITEFSKSYFYHRSPCESLAFSIWVLPFIRIDISFKLQNQIPRKVKLGKHIKLLYDKKGTTKAYLKKRKILTKRLSKNLLKELDGQFWMQIFFIFTRIEKSDYCAVYEGLHFVVKEILLKLRNFDYTSPPQLTMSTIKRKDPFIYKELEIILDFSVEPIDSLLRSIVLYKSLLKRIKNQEGIELSTKPEKLVLRTIQRGLISKPAGWR